MAPTARRGGRAKGRAPRGPREEAAGGVRPGTLRTADDRERREATSVGPALALLPLPRGGALLQLPRQLHHGKVIHARDGGDPQQIPLLQFPLLRQDLPQPAAHLLRARFLLLHRPFVRAGLPPGRGPPAPAGPPRARPPLPPSWRAPGTRGCSRGPAPAGAPWPEGRGRAPARPRSRPRPRGTRTRPAPPPPPSPGVAPQAPRAPPPPPPPPPRQPRRCRQPPRRGEILRPRPPLPL